MKALILGSGLIGAPMAIDLYEKGYDVRVVDLSKDALEKINNKKIEKIEGDLSNKLFLEEVSKDFDFVINALPGFLGFNILKTLIEYKKNVIDISFFPEDGLELNKLAQEQNVTVLYDCGVAPGLSNFVSGYISFLFKEIEELKIYVGGLPVERILPFEYKAVFSPLDVIEEYTRPVHLIENFKQVIKEPLTDCEIIYFPGIGSLEAANTDGLRSLTKTINAKNMVEKTLRYPGYYDKIKFLIEAGFFEKEKIFLNNVEISPIDFSSKILSKKWKLNQGDEDLTVMRIFAKGKIGKEEKEFKFELFDRYDKITNTHSMARTTGYTATTFFEVLTNNEFKEKGVFPLEKLGGNETFFVKIIEKLRKRNFNICYQIL